jgi:hypothetical protein
VTLLRFIECVMSVVCIACVPGSCPAQTGTNVAPPALERTTYILGPGDEVLIHAGTHLSFTGWTGWLLLSIANIGIPFLRGAAILGFSDIGLDLPEGLGASEKL